MSFGLRLLIVTMTAFAVTNLIASGVVARVWTRRLRGDASDRAGALVRMRSVPVAAATAAALWAALTFLVFEPRHQDETFGIVLTMLASVPAVLVAGMACRAARLIWIARQTRRTWLRGATPIAINGISIPAYAVSTTFPIVAVLGLLRPRLIVARSVLRACTAGELGAILAHEQGHVTHRDNLTRVWLALAPDVFGWLPGARRLAASWHQAAEDAADDAASALGQDVRLALAGALVRVARIAPPVSGATPLPATALYRGNDVARRVRRLLSPPAAPAPQRARTIRRALAASCAIAACLFTMDLMHDVVEAVVTLLP